MPKEEQKGKKRKIQTTLRDVEVLKFINHFGYCSLPQIGKRFSLKAPRVYHLVWRLVQLGLVKRNHIFHRQAGIITVTPKGASFTELPKLPRIMLATYQHDLGVIDLHLKLRQQYREAEWITERQLKHEKYFAGVGQKGHMADALLVMPNGDHMAIELELSFKGTGRLEKIFRSYRASHDIKEVWYFCSSVTLDKVQRVAKKISNDFIHQEFIKVHSLQETLGEDFINLKNRRIDL